MIGLLVWIALVGLIVYAIVTFIPMPAPFKQIIIVVAVVVVLLYLLQVFGISDLGPPIPRYHSPNT